MKKHVFRMTEYDCSLSNSILSGLSFNLKAALKPEEEKNKKQRNTMACGGVGGWYYSDCPHHWLLNKQVLFVPWQKYGTHSSSLILWIFTLILIYIFYSSIFLTFQYYVVLWGTTSTFHYKSISPQHRQELMWEICSNNCIFGRMEHYYKLPQDFFKP